MICVGQDISAAAAKDVMGIDWVGIDGLAAICPSFDKGNVLTEAAKAMLREANKTPEDVLQLLQ